MPKQAGYIEIKTPDEPTIELDTLQCVHCGLHFPKSNHAKEAKRKALTPLEAHFYELEGKRVTGFCHNCNGPICSAKCMACVPMEAGLEIMEGTRNPTAVSVGVILPPGVSRGD